MHSIQYPQFHANTLIYNLPILYLSIISYHLTRVVDHITRYYISITHYHLHSYIH